MGFSCHPLDFSFQCNWIIKNMSFSRIITSFKLYYYKRNYIGMINYTRKQINHDKL